MILSNHKGFSLIELTLVLIVIGFVAVIAFPRFMNLTNEASEASAKALSGSFTTAIYLAHTQWLASNKPTHVLMNGQWIGVSPNVGFPECTGQLGSCSAGTLDNRLTETECVNVWNAILQVSPLAAKSSDCEEVGCKYLVEHGSSNPEYCRYTDEAGAGPNSIYYYYQTGLVILQPSS